MSTLTKLFVALLIVCSLLLTAGVVVFANQSEVFTAAAEQQQAKIRGLEGQARTADERALAAQNREQQTASDSTRQLSELNTQITQRTQESQQRVAEAAQLRQRIAVQDANLADASGALKVQAQNLSDIQKRYDDVVKQMDGVRTENVSLVAANTDYQRRLDTLERELQYTNELLAQSKATPTQAPGGAGGLGARGSAGAPSITSVIGSQPRKEGDVVYATIKVGAANRVERNMQFNIIDPRQGVFLGKFIVESVQQNESFGRIEGPRRDEVRQDHEVRTQI